MATIESGATSDLLTVDPTSKAGRFTPYSSGGVEQLLSDGQAYASNLRGIATLGINDDNMRIARMDRTGGTAVALMTPLLHEPFEGATLAINRWLTTATTMAAAQTDAGLVFNSGNITTINTGYLWTSLKRFPRIARAPLHAKFRARLNFVSNSVIEFGFGAPATFNGATPVGAYFQVTSGGVLQPVITYNSVDLTGSPISIVAANYYTFDIILDDDEATFLVQDTSTGLIISEQTIRLPLTQNRLWNISHLPVYARLYNSGTIPASAPQLILTEAFVGALDTVLNKHWPLAAAQMGYGGTYQPLTFAQTENNGNSAAPANTTLANAGPGLTTLGGRFGFAALGGAVTDFVMFGFQVPVGYQYVCTGIDIDAMNTGAAVATTPTVLDWSIAHNGSAVTLGNADYRKRSIGMQSFPIGAVIGTLANRIQSTFEHAPIVTESGRFFTLVLRLPVGTATASQVIQGIATPRGIFE